MDVKAPPEAGFRGEEKENERKRRLMQKMQSGITPNATIRMERQSKRKRRIRPKSFEERLAIAWGFH